jgi:hypothetical protein
MDDLAVLAIPAVLVTGLVLVGLGVDGRTGAGRSGRGWRGRFQDWATQAGFAGSARGRWPPCAAGPGWPLAWRSWP